MTWFEIKKNFTAWNRRAKWSLMIDKLKEYENERWDKEVQSYQRLMGTTVKNSYHSPEQHERIYGVVEGF